jgi:hypothetical protein
MWGMTLAGRLPGIWTQIGIVLTLDSRRKYSTWVKPTRQRGVLAVPRLCVFNIDSLVLISERECVYCAVRLESLAKTGDISCLKTVSRLRIIAGISRRTQGSIPGQILSDSWTGARRFPEYYGSHLSVSFYHHCSILAFIHALLTWICLTRVYYI